MERGYETSICVIRMEPLSARNTLLCILIQHKVRKISIESEPVYMQCDSHFLQQTRQTLKWNRIRVCMWRELCPHDSQMWMLSEFCLNVGNVWKWNMLRVFQITVVLSCSCTSETHSTSTWCKKITTQWFIIHHGSPKMHSYKNHRSCYHRMFFLNPWIACQCGRYCSLNAIVAQSRNCPFGVIARIELKNIETLSHKNGIWQVMFQLRSALVLSDVAVTFFSSIITLNLNDSF